MAEQSPAPRASGRETALELGTQRSSFGTRVSDLGHLEVLGLIDRVSPPKCILDIGCGGGRLLRQARELFPEASLIGVDPEEKALKQARRIVPDGSFYASTVDSLPLPDQSVDVALTTFSFHHWPDPEKGVKEIVRMLRPGGRLLVADLWPPFGLWVFARHFWPSKPARVREMCTRGGIAVVGQKRKMGRFLMVTIGERPALRLRE